MGSKSIQVTSGYWNLQGHMTWIYVMFLMETNPNKGLLLSCCATWLSRGHSWKDNAGLKWTLGQNSAEASECSRHQLSPRMLPSEAQEFRTIICPKGWIVQLWRLFSRVGGLTLNNPVLKKGIKIENLGQSQICPAQHPAGDVPLPPPSSANCQGLQLLRSWPAWQVESGTGSEDYRSPFSGYCCWRRFSRRPNKETT